MVKTSVSERLVSSNPGVSIKVAVRPPMVKGDEISTPRVHDLKPVPTSRSDPETKLMNCPA